MDVDIRAPDEVGQKQRLAADVICSQVGNYGVGKEADEGLCGDLVFWIESFSINFSLSNAPAAASFVNIAPCWVTLRASRALSPIEADNAAPSAVIVMLHAIWSMAWVIGHRIRQWRW